MKKIILASVTVTGVIVSALLIWKFYPRGNKEVLDIHNPSEVIEEDSLVSLFAGSSLVKGGSSSFLILGIIALAFFYIRRKKQNSPPLPSSPGPQHKPQLPPNGDILLLSHASLQSKLPGPPASDLSRPGRPATAKLPSRSALSRPDRCCSHSSHWKHCMSQSKVTGA